MWKVKVRIRWRRGVSSAFMRREVSSVGVSDWYVCEFREGGEWLVG